MSEQKQILIVDDEEFNRVMLEGLLEENYKTVTVVDGQQCLQTVEDEKPDLIILDVDMPGIDGLECCRRLRDNYSNLELPIVFVSGMTSDEDRLEGYKAGGDDYITKPYNEDELLLKIKAILSISSAGKESQISSVHSQKIVNEAFDNISEIEHILDFVKKSFSCNSFEELAQELFTSLKIFNLQASVLFAEQQKLNFYFDDTFQRPLEITALTKVYSTENKLIDFGSKTIFNGPLASLLIRNMPTENTEMSERLKNHFMTLIEALSSRIKGINAEYKQAERQTILTRMIEATKSNLKDVEKEQSAQQLAVTKLLSDIGRQIEELFPHFGLESQQEEAIINVVSQAEKNSGTLFDTGIDLETRFGLIIHALETTK